MLEKMGVLRAFASVLLCHVSRVRAVLIGPPISLIRGEQRSKYLSGLNQRPLDSGVPKQTGITESRAVRDVTRNGETRPYSLSASYGRPWSGPVGTDAGMGLCSRAFCPDEPSFSTSPKNGNLGHLTEVCSFF